MFGTGPMLPILPQPPSLLPPPPSAKHFKRPSKEPPASLRRPGHRYKPAFNQFSLSLHNLLMGASAEQPYLMAKHEEGGHETSSQLFDLKEPLEIHWTIEDVQRMSKEIYDETIPEVHLSLFGMWINESVENYEIAKSFIRELGLDQGYNVDRITNPHVRVLLADTYEARPSEPAHALSTKKHFRFLSNGPKNNSMDKDTLSNTESGSFSLRPKNLILQPFRPLGSHGVQDSTYPPDTPDRPEPLSVKSPSSNGSKISMPMNNASRSVSTPSRSRKLPPLPLPRYSVLIQDTMAHPLISPPATMSTTRRLDSIENVDGNTGTDDKITKSQSDPFVDPNLSYLNQSYGPIGGDMHSEFDSGDRLRAFQSTKNITATGDITDQSPLDQIAPCTESNHTKVCDGGYVEEGSLDVMQLYAESDDGRSILESASSTSDHGNHTMYKYATSSPSPRPELELPPLSIMDRSHSNTRRANLHEPRIEHHHAPLLRGYRSEAHIGSMPYYSTNDSHSEHIVTRARSKYDIHSRRQAVCHASTIPLTNSTETGSHNEAKTSTTGKHCDPRSTQLPTYAETSSSSRRYGSQDRPRTMELAAFPIPPMKNPVGVLPMLISRAISPSPATKPTPKTRPRPTHTSTSVSEAYRAITKIQMTETLKKTRARGAKLPKVDWDSLSPADQEWRKENKMILISIYGSRDVMLTQHDMDYVNCISQEVRSDGDEVSANEWVLRVFRDDA